MTFDHDKINKEAEVSLVHLVSINNNMDLGIVETILRDNNVPYIIRDSGSGSYMRIISGTSIFSTDIFVEESSYEKALALIDIFVNDEENWPNKIRFKAIVLTN